MLDQMLSFRDRVEKMEFCEMPLVSRSWLKGQKFAAMPAGGNANK